MIDVPFFEIGKVKFTNIMAIILITYWVTNGAIEFTRAIIKAWNEKPQMKRRFEAFTFLL